jgi:hypothetical protein
MTQTVLQSPIPIKWWPQPIKHPLVLRRTAAQQHQEQKQERAVPNFFAFASKLPPLNQRTTFVFQQQCKRNTTTDGKHNTYTLHL